MNELHELAKVARHKPHYIRPGGGAPWSDLHRYIGAALIIVGGVALVAATEMRRDPRISFDAAQDWAMTAYGGAAAIIAGNVWYFAAWLAKRRRR